jgi:hypothetical protein
MDGWQQSTMSPTARCNAGVRTCRSRTERVRVVSVLAAPLQKMAVNQALTVEGEKNADE